jgi:hypothetical protein
MPELTPEDQLEVQADRRRRVAAAFRLGSEARPGTPSPSWVGPLAAGVGLTIAIALAVGIITLVHH